MPVVALTRDLWALQLRGVPEPGANHLQLLAHELGNRLPVHSFRLRPLDRIVGDLYGELHRHVL